MKRIFLCLAFMALMAAATPNARAYSRISIGFTYGSPYYWYSQAYAYPVVVDGYYPPYRFYRRYRPYHLVFFRHRPHTRIVVRGCY